MRIELDLEPDAEPIAGRLTGPGGTIREFHGWTALAGALEATLAERPPADDTASRATPGTRPPGGRAP